jgi:large subunit ribosomal protein L10
MALNLDGKKAVVAEVRDVAAGADSLVLAEYRGLSVSQLTELRSKARESGVYLKVVKNTLAKLAIKDTQFECIDEYLKGPIIIALSKDDPGAAARLVKNFSKDNENLVAIAVALEGQAHGPESIAQIASLPTLDEARATLLRILQAPLTQFVRTINEVPSSLVRVLNAKSQQG